MAWVPDVQGYIQHSFSYVFSLCLQRMPHPSSSTLHPHTHHRYPHSSPFSSSHQSSCCPVLKTIVLIRGESRLSRGGGRNCLQGIGEKKAPLASAALPLCYAENIFLACCPDLVQRLLKVGTIRACSVCLLTYH